MDKPPLWDTVNTLYHGATDWMPQWVQDRDIALAALLGSSVTYGVVRGLQWTSKNLMGKIIPNFDEKWLPKLEKICIAGITLPVLYAFLIEPQIGKEIVTQNPTYAAGMSGIYVAGVAGALQDLNKRSKNKTIDDAVSQ